MKQEHRPDRASWRQISSYFSVFIKRPEKARPKEFPFRLILILTLVDYEQFRLKREKHIEHLRGISLVHVPVRRLKLAVPIS